MTWDEFTKAAANLSWVTYLATRGADGRPHVAPVSVGFSEETIWFGSLTSSRKIRNLRADPRLALHWPVETGTGPGELFARGTAKLHESPAAKHRLWHEIELAYDPAQFFQSPDNPDLVFVETAASYASLLGPDFKREVWRRAT